MKKLLFGLIATVMFGFVGNAQKVSKEEARLKFATSMSELVQDLSPYYKRGNSYNDFLLNILTGGTTGPTFPIPPEGDNLLRKAHDLLSRGTSTSDIIKNYDGIEMAKVADLIKDCKTSNEANIKLFGEKFVKESKYATDSQKISNWPPKWLTNVLNWIWDNHNEIITILCMFFNC